MTCHICDHEAVGRCYTCGGLFCEVHGSVNCVRCETGIVPGDSRDDRISRVRLTETARPNWWRPQEAEDYEPPACAVCQGLARNVCIQCGDRYCGTHAGQNGLCSPCQRKLRGGNLLLALLIIGMGVLTALGLLQPHW